MANPPPHVLYFLVFLYRPGGPKGPKYFFRKRPGQHSKRAGAVILRMQNRSAQGGVYSHYYRKWDLSCDGT